MKPAEFAYHSPGSLSEALELLANPDAKALAGGQSLMPMLSLRLVRTDHLVDINRLSELGKLHVDGAEVRAGALARHADLEDSHDLRATFPLVHGIACRLAYRAVRNRGTVCGSLAHADPAAEWPLVLVGLGGRVVTRSANDVREIEADDFFVGPFETTLREDELLVETIFPNPPDWRWGFHKFARKAHEFALAAALIGVRLGSAGDVREVRVAVSGAENRPLRLLELEQRLTGTTAEQLPPISEFEAAVADLEPSADIHGRPEYKRALVATVCRRAFQQAVTANPNGGGG